MPLAAETIAQPAGTVRATRRHRNYPVALHLALFAAGILAPVLLIVSWMLIDSTRLWREDSLHDAGMVVHELNATIEVEIDKSFAVAQALAASIVVSDGDYTALDRQARDVANRLGMVIVARDPSGHQILNTASPEGSLLPNSNETILAVDRLAAQRKEPVISDLVAGTVTKIPLVIADVPVLKGSEAVSFIDVTLYPTRIGEILSRGLPEGWIAGVIGRDGRLIARSVDQDRYIGTTNPAFLEAAKDRSGTWTGTAREGVDIAGAYLRSPLSGWVVSVAVPETVLQAPARTAMLWLLSLVVASLAISGVLGWTMSRQIASPIRGLVTQARGLGEGRRTVLAPCSVSEINAVTEALATASIELDRRADAARLAADAVRANEERLQLVQETAGIGAVDWNLETGESICSPRYYEIFSLPPGTRMSFGNLDGRAHPDEKAHIERMRAIPFSEGGTFDEEIRILTPAGEDRWVQMRGRVDVKNGRPARMLGAYTDITERKRSEEHLRFLLRELSHRSKNLLAVIQAMATQTAKSAETVDVFRRRFGERLMGLAASHDLLVNQNWLGASVENLVRGQLSPFVDAQDPRLRIEGPSVDVKSEAAEALGLALHELATNSVKYGALGEQAGKVEIRWDVLAAEPGPSGRRFRMDWIERTVIPVPPPTHKGFGRMVIEHIVQTRMEGTVTLEFPPEGLRWRIDAPVSCLAPTSRGPAA